jgi:hypothetical protein
LPAGHEPVDLALVGAHHELPPLGRVAHARLVGLAREVAFELVDSGGPDGGSFRALRGGSFVLDGIFVRNAMRMRLRADVRADDVGFRVLREASPPATIAAQPPHDEPRRP